MTSAILFVCTANLCRSPMAEGLARRLAGELVHQRGRTLADEPERGTSDGSPGVDVGSAGVAASDGSPPHPHAAAVLERRGVLLPEFASRRLRAEHIEGADLVLTATRAHRAQCVRLVPSATRRCFTLAQLSRLAGVVEGEGLARRNRAGVHPGASAEPGSRAATTTGLSSLLAAVPLARARLQPVSADEDDLADPVLAGQEAFEECADRIERLLAAPLRLICS